MIPEQIKKLYEATPFRPFRVHMANGKWVDVPHPEFMHLSPSGRRLIVDDTEEDCSEIIDVLLVTSLETLPVNGRRGRRKRR
jgi:hypothetical protein